MKFPLGRPYEYLKSNRNAFIRVTCFALLALIGGIFVNLWLAIFVGIASAYSVFWNLRNAWIIYLATTLLIPARFSWRIIIIDIGPSRFFLVLFLLTWVYYWRKGEVKIRKTPLDTAIFILIFSMLLSFSINSFFMNDSQFNQALKTLGVSIIEWFFIFYATSTIAKNWEEVEKYLKIIMGFTASISLVGIFEFIANFRIYDWILKYLPEPTHETAIGLQSSGAGVARAGMERIVSTTVSPHEVGLIMAMCLPFAMYFLAYKQKLYDKGIWISVVALIVIALGLSITRGATLASLAVLVCLSLLSYKWSLRFGFYFVMVFVSISFIFLPNIRNTYLGIGESSLKIIKAGSTKSDLSYEARSEDWPEAKKLLKDHEVAGIGLGIVTGHELDYFNQVSPSFFYTDNYYLAALTETGIIGISAYIFLGMSIIVFLSRKEQLAGVIGLQVRDLRIVFLASSLAFLVMCATFDALAFSAVARFFWVVLGLAASLAISEKSASKMAQSV